MSAVDNPAPIVDYNPSPCLGCRHEARCKAQELACRALELHVNTGRFSAVAPRQPSAAIFARVFAEEA